ncbi:MAG: hypothetical protein CVV44_03925 [Spirochaetae bacterium HGW-Spirochaetae-1]|jgi:hypothetical protein|nr:MAG: hypothetical protein CVV44_03925 [Spirochaetae bacterium HGW-Spirochaetae-1]
MIKTDSGPMKITSPFGVRGGVPHKGVDIRSWDDAFRYRLDAVLPEDAIYLRSVHQEKWGWTHVFTPVKSGGEIKFTHITPVEFVQGDIYDEGTVVGQSTRTEYMIEKGYGEHLHFERWKYHTPYNPLKYFDELGKKYEVVG